MTHQSLLFIFLIIILGFGLSLFQYHKAVFKKDKTALLLFVLRGISYSIIGVLLLQLSIKQRTSEKELTDLVLAVDNSNSIAQLADTTQVKEWVNSFIEDEKINERFNLVNLQFGNKINTLQELDFLEQETNLGDVFLESKQLIRSKKTPMVLLSDGNTTFGSNPVFESKQAMFHVFPVVLGDTTSYADSKIDQINLNSYAFLNNKFPIEIFVSYQGESDFDTKIQLREKGRIIEEQLVSFSKNQPTKRIMFEVLASEVGVKNFEVRLKPQTNEKQLENNIQEIGIEIIDESTNILIVTSFLHPDLSALKKSIESNQQRKLKILPIEEFSGNLEDVNLVIFYQPKSDFASAFEQVNQAKIPHIVITGTKTNYSFLNRIQNDFTKQINQSKEEYFPSFNTNFSLYQQDDLNFNNFPPLEDTFGSIELKQAANVLLHQKIQGVETEEPMMFFVSQSAPKRAYLLGEQFWRWRAESFLQENKSFQSFDNFMNKWVGYLSLEQKKSRLIVEANSFYKTQRNAKIKATLFDQNYTIDRNSSLYIKFENEEGTTREFPMLFTGSRFEFNLDALEAGDYNYEIFSPEQKLSRTGRFKLIPYSAESQFVNANSKVLKSISKNAKLFTLNDFEVLKRSLLESKAYQPIQKESINLKPLIDWKILFIFLIVSLSLEWFFRKYNGLI